MDVILIKGEPLGAALARLAINECQTPGEWLCRLLDTRRVQTFGFTLPLHLDQVAQRLPSKIGASAEWLAENYTFFAAIAPLLEATEREALLKAMSEGKRLPALPITFCRKSRVRNSIRYCPVCAARDRNEGWGATWRMVHNLFGVTACPVHGCRLVSTGRAFNADTIVVEADSIIPQQLPGAESATEEEILLAQDLSALFTPETPRPGRARIAAALAQAFHEGRMAALVETPGGRRRLVQMIEQHFAMTFQSIFGSSEAVRPHTWVASSSRQARVVPMIHIAMLARLAGSSLPKILTAAAALPNVALTGFSSVAIPSLSGACAPAPTAGPTRGRRDLSLKWAAHDQQRESDVRRQAKAWKLANRHKRITGNALVIAVGASNWRRPGIWATKLPRFHAALREESESMEAFTERKIMALVRARGGLGRIRTTESLLVAAGVSGGARDNPEVRAVAARLLEDGCIDIGVDVPLAS